MIKSLVILLALFAMLIMQTPAWIIISVIVYLSILFITLKMLQINKR